MTRFHQCKPLSKPEHFWSKPRAAASWSAVALHRFIIPIRARQSQQITNACQTAHTLINTPL